MKMNFYQEYQRFQVILTEISIDSGSGDILYDLQKNTGNPGETGWLSVRGERGCTVLKRSDVHEGVV